MRRRSTAFTATILATLLAVIPISGLAQDRVMNIPNITVLEGSNVSLSSGSLKDDLDKSVPSSATQRADMMDIRSENIPSTPVMPFMPVMEQPSMPADVPSMTPMSMSDMPIPTTPVIAPETSAIASPEPVMHSGSSSLRGDLDKGYQASEDTQVLGW